MDRNIDRYLDVYRRALADGPSMSPTPLVALTPREPATNMAVTPS